MYWLIFNGINVVIILENNFHIIVNLMKEKSLKSFNSIFNWVLIILLEFFHWSVAYT